MKTGGVSNRLRSALADPGAKRQFFSFITVLSWAEVSFVVPATAANYIAGALGAKFLLKERVSKARWAGVLLVAAGVALVCAAH